MICKNCGSNIDDNSKFCNACGMPTAVPQVPTEVPQAPTAVPQAPAAVPQAPAAVPQAPTAVPQAPAEAPKKEKKKKKKLPLIIISIVLVIAIIVGGILFAVNNTPLMSVYNAAKNTVFNSSEINIKVKIDWEDNEYFRNHREEYDIAILVGDDIDSSEFEIKSSTSYEYYNEYYEYYDDYYYDDYYYGDYYYGDYYYDDYYGNSGEWVGEWEKHDYDDKYSIKNGKLYVDGDNYGSVSAYLEDAEYNLDRNLDVDIDLEEEINGLLNGKLDEKALEKIYDEIVAPNVEEQLSDVLDETIDLPEYDYLSGTSKKLFKDEAFRNAIVLEKIKSDLPGKTYEYTIKVEELAEAVLKYAMEDEQYKAYLELAADRMDCDVEDVVDDIVDSFDDFDDITGTITIKSNRITNITINIEDECKIEIEIESKK